MKPSSAFLPPPPVRALSALDIQPPVVDVRQRRKQRHAGEVAAAGHDLEGRLGPSLERQGHDFDPGGERESGTVQVGAGSGPRRSYR
jgi:hypothetical protein